MPSKRRTAKEHSPNHFKVDWREDYGPDIISLNWFKEIGTANKAHTFGKRGKAYCQVVVSDSTADLIYDDEFLDDNTRLEVMLGRARFKFADEARTNVSEGRWCGDGSGRSEPVTNCAVKKLYIPPSSSIEGDIENRVIKTPYVIGDSPTKSDCKSGRMQFVKYASVAFGPSTGNSLTMLLTSTIRASYARADGRQSSTTSPLCALAAMQSCPGSPKLQLASRKFRST